MRLLVTGVESGIGKALVREALKRGHEVLALGRSLPPEFRGVRFVLCDLLEVESIYRKVEELTRGIDNTIDVLVLNAGTLGRIGSIKDTPLSLIHRVMDVNVWANKLIIDSLLELGVGLGLVVGMSSGASLSCDKGWNVYAISKAGLNCLLKTYANEFPDIHFISLSPGLIKTPMLESILSGNEELYPAVKKVREAPKMDPEEAGRRILDIIPKLKELPNGSYVDIKELI